MNQSDLLKKTKMNYPKPKNIGGALIRKVMQLMNQFAIKRPIDSHILIACSGGADSTALSHLLVFFGRRLIDKKYISLLHINHGWRGEDSDRDEQFVSECAEKWDVGFILKKLNPKAIQKGESWEDHARKKRNEIFQELLHKKNAKKYKYIFTAHHANDLAETMLWRFCTGNIERQGAGIFFENKGVLRPFLGVFKKDILKYLTEENLEWREDFTNQETRFLRNSLRIKIMNEIESLFPRFTQRMLEYALNLQLNSGRQEAEGKRRESELWPALDGALKKSSLYLRKNQWDEIKKQSISKAKNIEIALPGQWKLKREKPTRALVSERWVLELEKTKKNKK